MYVRNILAIAALLAARKVTASCLHGTSLLPRQVDEEGRVEVSNFGYTGELGPTNWAAIDPANIACATSSVQSPINIDQSIALAAEPPTIRFQNVREAEFENLGSTVEVVVNGTTIIGGKEFTLQQFHFHTPSEHRIGEEYFPAEMHMVHEAADGSGALAVMAVLFDLSLDGSTTPLLTGALQNIGRIREPGTVTTTGPLIFNQVVNHLRTTPLFQYTGSLTTPPCAEGLEFLVTAVPMPINVQTFRALKSVVKFNSRYTQNTLGQQNLLLVAGQNAEVNRAVCNGEVNNGNETATATDSLAQETATATESASATESAAEETATATDSAAEETATATDSAAEETATATESATESAEETATATESAAAEETTRVSKNKGNGRGDNNAQEDDNNNGRNRGERENSRASEADRERRYYSRSCRGNCARAIF